MNDNMNDNMNNNYNNYNPNDYNTNYNNMNFNNNNTNQTSYNMNVNNNNNNMYLMLFALIIVIIIGLMVLIGKQSGNKKEENKVDEELNAKTEMMVETIDNYIMGATTAVNNNEFGALSDQSIMYYIPVSDIERESCITLERGGSSSLGDWEKAYVVVNYDASRYSYNYYFTFRTIDGYEMPLTASDDIKKSKITKSDRFVSENITSQTTSRDKKTKVLLTPTEVTGYQDNYDACSSKSTK